MKNDSLYTEIESLAELQFTTKEISIITEQPESVFQSDTKAVQAFLKGRLKAQAEVRRSILNMARQGSTPAQKEFQQLVEMSEQDYETD